MDSNMATVALRSRAWSLISPSSGTMYLMSGDHGTRACHRGAMDGAVSNMESNETERSGRSAAVWKVLRCAALERTKPTLLLAVRRACLIRIPVHVSEYSANFLEAG